MLRRQRIQKLTAARAARGSQSTAAR